MNFRNICFSALTLSPSLGLGNTLTNTPYVAPNFVPDAGNHTAPDYESAKAKFNEISYQIKKTWESLGREVDIFAETLDQKELEIGFTHIEPKSGDKDKLLVIVSGVHGIEGYINSGVQHALVSEVIKNPDFLPEDTGLLLVHSANPFGMKYGRRFDEENIDLNRNGRDDFEEARAENPNYERLKRMIVEHGNPDTSVVNGTCFACKAINIIRKEGYANAKDMVSGGQYRDPEGVYYGGSEIKENYYRILKHTKRVASEYRYAETIDLHSGLGNGEAVQILTEDWQSERFRPIEKSTGDYQVKVESTDNISVRGPIIDKLAQDLGFNSFVTLEIGTDDGISKFTRFLGRKFPKIKSTSSLIGSTLTSIRNLYITQKELQAFNYDTDAKTLAKIRHDLSGIFYSRDPNFRKASIDKVVRLIQYMARNPQQ